MKYTYWVIPRLLAGRPGPDEVGWNLEELYRNGFRTILSLHDGGADQADIKRHGFIHKLLPLPNSGPPSPGDILIYRQLLPKALSVIEQWVRNGDPTLVHCHAGKDRTGVVLACYLSRYPKLKPSEAIARLRAIKPDLLTAEGYEALVYHLLARLP